MDSPTRVKIFWHVRYTGRGRPGYSSSALMSVDALRQHLNWLTAHHKLSDITVIETTVTEVDRIIDPADIGLEVTADVAGQA